MTKRYSYPKPTFPIEKVEFDGERPYVITRTRKVSGEVVERRRYGDIRECHDCGQKYLCVNPKTAAGMYCSKACSARGGPPRTRSSQPHRWTKKGMKARCDQLFSAAIRAKGSCERCGLSDPSQLQCAHVFSRRYLNTRWTLDNALCLCKKCHVWGHSFPLEWEQFAVSKIGQERYDELKREALGTYPLDYHIILGHLEQLLAAIKDISWDDEDAVNEAVYEATTPPSRRKSLQAREELA